MPVRHLVLSWLLLLLAQVTNAASQASEYHEQLTLTPLEPALLLASFEFRSTSTLSAFSKQHFRFFPRSLGQILLHSETRELHLRFTNGRWDAESWGARPWNGTKEGGTGVEMWAWINAPSTEAADAEWLTLTNALSGLFCASLNFIDSTRTTRPVMSFEPRGYHSATDREDLHLLHGILPGEVVCTENLTPFLKLLPCKGKAGISSLLDGHKLFDASWQSMSIDVEPVCASDREECELQITQTIDMVLDIQRSKRPRDNPIPRPVPFEELRCDTNKPYHNGDTCFPLDDVAQSEDWSIAQLFGRTIAGSCPLAMESTRPVCMNIAHASEVLVVGQSRELKDETKSQRCFALHPEQSFDLVVPRQERQPRIEFEKPLLYAERTFIGYGQEHGGVQAILRNPSMNQEVEFVYMESLPWFMKLYLHTVKVRIEGKEESVIDEMYYRPSLDRKRGSQLEIRMRVPANATVVLTYDFEKAILRYTEYPPDANRGFDVGPAIITMANSSIRTTSLLLSLPTPDFSMPYNVIILTSTVMALAFGSIFNLLVRRFVAADEAQQWNLSNVKAKLSLMLRILSQKFVQKSPNKQE